MVWVRVHKDIPCGGYIDFMVPIHSTSVDTDTVYLEKGREYVAIHFRDPFELLEFAEKLYEKAVKETHLYLEEELEINPVIPKETSPFYAESKLMKQLSYFIKSLG